MSDNGGEVIYTITHAGREVEVTIEDVSPSAYFVRAVCGFPFQLETHGYGLYVVQGNTHWYDHIWVNKTDVKKKGE